MEWSVWNVGNNKKKGIWKQGTVGLMLFRCDYAETTINYYYYSRRSSNQTLQIIGTPGIQQRYFKSKNQTNFDI